MKTSKIRLPLSQLWKRDRVVNNQIDWLKTARIRKMIDLQTYYYSNFKYFLLLL